MRPTLKEFARNTGQSISSAKSTYEEFHVGKFKGELRKLQVVFNKKYKPSELVQVSKELINKMNSRNG